MKADTVYSHGQIPRSNKMQLWEPVNSVYPKWGLWRISEVALFILTDQLEKEDKGLVIYLPHQCMSFICILFRENTNQVRGFPSHYFSSPFAKA